MTNLDKEKEQVRSLVTEVIKMFFERNYNNEVVVSAIENIISTVAFNSSIDSKTDPYQIIDELANSAKGHIKLLEKCRSGEEAEDAGIIEVVTFSNDTLN